MSSVTGRISAVIALMAAGASAAWGEMPSPTVSTKPPVIRPVIRLGSSLGPFTRGNAPASALQVVLTPTATPGATFREQHPILGRISANIERAGLSSPTDVDFEPIEMTEIRNRGVLRAAKKAMKGFILEDLEIYHRDSSRSDAPGVDAGPPRAVRVRLGVSHLAPKINVRYAAGSGTVGLTVNAHGSASVDLTSGGAGNTRVNLGYDHRSKTTAVAFRIAF